ncbi:MAG: response regulator transcription factor [Bacteroidetes bacterium]|nr:MAG: response regulator transcription factor [Bacteroidota bacterium]
MTIKAVIVDDEKHCTQGLVLQLKEVCPQVEVIATFNSSVQALDFVRQNSFDLLFLDVEMPQLNGFDFLKQLESHNFDVVFTTAYDQFAIKAFKFSAFDYLLKPIDDDELKAVIAKWEKTKKTPASPQAAMRFEVLLEQLNNQIGKKLVLPTAEGMELIDVDTIVCIDSDSNYSRLFFSDGESLLVSRTLKDFEDLLDTKGFMRIHHSHIVNIKKMRKYLKADGGYVVMSNGRKVSISRARKDQVLEVISQISL